MQQTQNSSGYRVRINGYIRVPQVRVILEDGTSPGIMETWQALKLAQEQSLDLVEINPKSVPPVAKICNYGKMKYEEKKAQQAAKKKQKVSETKELDFRPVTEQHDLEHKLDRAKEFLLDGHRVKFVCKFKGREMAHKQIGQEKLLFLLEQLKEMIAVPGPIGMEGKDMIVIVSPKATK
jgi:translation initiation factor IF-3